MKVSGVSYEIDWKAFKKGSSFAVPCVNPEEAKKEVQQVTDRLRMKIHTKVVIEDGIKTLRIWRV